MTMAFPLLFHMITVVAIKCLATSNLLGKYQFI